MADAVSSNNASPSADLILGAILIMIGCALAVNLREISTTLFRNGTGFTPWGRRRERWQGPNPVRIVGACFLVGGLITFILGIVRMA
jgi:hypothetical protein